MFWDKGPKYLVKTRTLVPNKRGQKVRRGPWRTIRKFSDEASAFEFAAKLEPKFATRIFHQGKRV